jgi:dihydroneopterin aldolase
MSHVFLENLVVSAKHGVHDHEKINAQRFDISVNLDVTTPSAFHNDNVIDTISYSDLRQNIIDIAQDQSFNLIERLAQEIIDSILQDKRVNSVTVTIKKLDIYPDTVPGITVTQSRVN